MSTRRMKGPFGSGSILFVAMAVMLAMAGLIWAHWYTSLNVEANVNTGNVGIEWADPWTNDDGVVNDWDDFDDGGCPWLPDGECIYDQWGDSSGDPAVFGEGDRYEKDVARCIANGGGDGIWIDIDNGYPSYHCTIQTGIHNYGSIPIKAMPSSYEVYRGEQDCGWWWNYDENENMFYERVPFDVRDALYEAPDHYRPYAELGGDPNAFDPGTDKWILWWEDEFGGFDYVDWNDTDSYEPDFDQIIFGGCNFYGEPIEVLQGDGWFEWGWTDENGWHAEVTGEVPNLFECGQQIEPDQWYDAWFNFHIEQEAAQNATYRLMMHQEFVNYNEFDEFSCGIDVGEGALGDFTKGMGARYKAFNNPSQGQLYVGVGDLGVGANRVEDHVSPVDSPGWHHLQVSYDPGADTLTGSFRDVELVYPNVSATAGCPVGEMDRMQIYVLARDPGAYVELTNVQLNGAPVGDAFVGGASFADGTWNIVGYPFHDGFHMSGDMYIDGDFTTSNEDSKVEFLVGCPTP